MVKKIDPDSKRVDKALKLYILLLVSNRKFTTTELTQRLNCSKQSVRAIVDDLNANPDIEVIEETDEKTRVKRYYMEHCRPGVYDPITLDGYRQMELCRDLIGDLLPIEDQNSLNRALFDASSYLPRKDRFRFKTFSVATSFSKGHIDYNALKEVLHQLYRCISENRCCILSYQKFVNGETKDYYVAPKRIICLKYTLYIAAFTVEDVDGVPQKKHPECTNFSVHRIKGISVLDDKSSEHLPEAVKTQDSFGMISEKDPFRAVLNFKNPNAITYVADRRWSPDQTLNFNDDGTLTLSFTSDSYYETLSFVLSFGSSVEVIEPEWLREEVKKEALELKKLYKE